MEVSLLLQAVGRLINTLLAESYETALSDTEPPCGMLILAGAIFKVAIRTLVTDSCAAATWFSDETLMVALPGATAVMFPTESTFAIPGLELDQLTRRSGNESPDSLSGVAISRVVMPVATLATDGVIVTSPTAARVTATLTRCSFPPAEAITVV